MPTDRDSDHARSRELDSSLRCCGQKFDATSSSTATPKLDTTLIIDDGAKDGREGRQCPLFALVSLNASTAPTVEVPWSRLLALSLAEVDEEPVLTVGRHKDCNVQLVDPRVSLRHCEIVARRKFNNGASENPLSENMTYECFLNDCSSNGTTVNGNTVGKGNSVQLRSGDEICVLPAHRVGEEKMVTFVFRNTTEILAKPKEASTGSSLELDELVLCPICMQIIYKCVALMPCFHNFCMACYSEWMQRKEDCPVCRVPTATVVKNHAMEAVITAFLEANPDRRRSEEELRDMDRRDRLKLLAGGARTIKETCPIAAPTPAVQVDRVSGAGSSVGAAASGALASSAAPVAEAEAAGGEGQGQPTTARIASQVCSVQ